MKSCAILNMLLLPVASGFTVATDTRRFAMKPSVARSSCSATIRASKHDTVLGGITSLSEFLETAGELTIDERRTIINQALAIFEETFVHLPLKQAMHAVDPVQELKLLRRKVDALTERQFHDTMIGIFKSVRDLHTNYILPQPYKSHQAFLPFMMKEYYDEDGTRKYIVSHILIQGFEHETFGPNVEVTHWSGVPIDRAVEINSEREAGSNEDASHVRGLDAMTVRPMAMALPPDAEWVMVGYLKDGVAHEIRLDWQVYKPDPLPMSMDTSDAEKMKAKYSMGVDLNLELTNLGRKQLFVRDKSEKLIEKLKKKVQDKKIHHDDKDLLGGLLQTESKFPTTFNFKTISREDGDVGYLGIRTFGEPYTDEFIPEVIRILELLPQDRLLIDVRGNGGGIITNGERMLQLFTDSHIQAERLHFINTEVSLAIANSPVWGGFANKWARSIDLSLVTGSVYSQGFPIESAEETNAIGRKYPGKVALITDARCYSTTDIFAAGFQDHRLGPIVGVDNNTGAGGANVFTHDILRFILSSDPTSPFVDLPNGCDMRVAIRRTTRVGDNAGLPLEDLGVVPDHLYRMTRSDVLEGEDGLIDFAIATLD